MPHSIYTGIHAVHCICGVTYCSTVSVRLWVSSLVRLSFSASKVNLSFGIAYERICILVLYISVFVCLGIVQNVFVFGCVVWRWVQCKQGNHKEGACVGGGQSATHTCIVQYCSPKWWPVCYAYVHCTMLFSKMVASLLCI